MSPEFQFYLSSQSNILLNERFFLKTSKHVCERASIVVEVQTLEVQTLDLNGQKRNLVLLRTL